MIDAIVLGGGITALSTCWELVAQELSVLRIHRLRHGASSPAAAGMLSPASEADTAETELMKLAIESCQCTQVFEIESKSKLECSYNSNGTLLVALQRDHHSELSHFRTFPSHNGGLRQDGCQERSSSNWNQTLVHDTLVDCSAWTITA